MQAGSKRERNILKMPIPGVLNFLRGQMKKSGACNATPPCGSCAYLTGDWPEGRAIEKNHQGVDLLHCPVVDPDHWMLPPKSCTRYIPNVDATLR